VRKILAPRVDRITLKQLRTFTAYMREGTTKGAASRLNISPSAISQQLSLLEENVGAALTVKKMEGIQVTAFGQEVLTTASSVENQLSHCQTELARLNDISCGKVSIGIFNSASYFAPQLIAEFKKSYSHVEVRICIGNRENIFKGFQNYDYDFLVVGRPPEEEGMLFMEVGDHPHVFIGASDHPLVDQKNLKFRDLKNESFLVREVGSGTRLVMLNLFEEAGISPKLGMEVGNNESIKQAVISGLGIALISAHTVAAEVKDGRLKVFDIDGLPVIRKWFVVKHRNSALPSTAQALFDFFVDSGRSFFPDAIKSE